MPVHLDWKQNLAAAFAIVVLPVQRARGKVPPQAIFGFQDLRESMLGKEKKARQIECDNYREFRDELNAFAPPRAGMPAAEWSTYLDDGKWVDNAVLSFLKSNPGGQILLIRAKHNHDTLKRIEFMAGTKAVVVWTNPQH